MHEQDRLDCLPGSRAENSLDGSPAYNPNNYSKKHNSFLPIVSGLVGIGITQVLGGGYLNFLGAGGGFAIGNEIAKRLNKNSD